MASGLDVSASRLRDIKTFPSLVKYLRDDLDWPIESDDFEDLTFQWEPEELGIDPASAAKIQEIKQLRPLASGQPWGIFFVKFEPRRLPIVALRRVLRSLVLRKRASGNRADRAAWQLHDLLFISSYGESDHRDITFAHFAEECDLGDLPTLRVLGWDDEDTVSHLEHADRELREKLRWPDNPQDLDAWRSRWSSAFMLRHGEVIRTAKAMAERLAELAGKIRKRVNAVLRIESDKGPLRRLHKSFREALIHDLSEDDFADMYAQTISYGLLTARISRPAGIIGDNLRDMVPVTNPFLRDLLETFLTVGGRKGKIEFDELGVSEVVQMLRDADMEAVLRDFGDRNPQEDPAIHFYVLFLKEYDPEKRVKRGVFYTPRPVVSYIVRSVHELLQTEFGLPEGLASTATWGDMAKRHTGLRIPEGPAADSPFVQILDPAVGTGTFLVEVIDVVHKTMLAKWQKDGRLPLEVPKLWNEYVSKHLLPRLHGYELMMAPYAIAHMKIGLKLYETGYRFGSDERARIYLTNSLEPPHDFSDRLAFDAPALAHEAKAVNGIKREQAFTVIIGNPPYSLYSANLTIGARRLIDSYRFIDGERIRERGALQLEKNLQDDYVKFFAFSESALLRSRAGILAFITNHGYLGNRSLRGMRHCLTSHFNHVYVVDLHGSVSRARTGDEKDENVFDIQQGVAIGMFVAPPVPEAESVVKHTELRGLRQTKYDWLSRTSTETASWKVVHPVPEEYFFIPFDAERRSEWRSWTGIQDIMPIYSSGMVTARDAVTIWFDKTDLFGFLKRFSQLDEQSARREFDLGGDTKDWSVKRAQSDVRSSNWPDAASTVLYRPFDLRFTLYTGQARGFLCNPRRPVLQHMARGNNLALITNRQVNNDFQHVLATRTLIDTCTLSSATRETAYAFPLMLKAAPKSGQPQQLLSEIATTEVNFAPNFLNELARRIGGPEARSLPVLSELTEPETIFHYIYAILWSSKYRTLYRDLLRLDFPRIPLPGGLQMFRSLSGSGGELVGLHLLESSRLDQRVTKFIGAQPSEVEKISYERKTVWIDKDKTCGFQGVPEAVWNFRVGGYQVCEKWLKDRKGRTLSKDDIAHYHKIVVALSETIRLMKEIDEVIEKHGGWPGAFSTGTTDSTKIPEARA
jgi:predicted helicase